MSPDATGGDGQTLAREAMLPADHHAYHARQLATLAAILRGGGDPHPRA